MSISGTVSGQGHELIDSLGRLFGGDPKKPSQAETEPAAGLSALAEDFEAALVALDRRVAQQRESTTRGVGSAEPGEDRVAEKRVRQKLAQRAMREDIERMHARLKTGMLGAELDALLPFLHDLEQLAKAGQGSHALLPRARGAIAERLRIETGEIAVTRLVSLLERHGIAWPDPTQSHPKATAAEIESSRRRRLGELRENFVTYGFERIAERLQGVVSGWGADYPDRGSRLWEESVLKGVAAALWARLLEDSSELLKRKQKQLRALAEEAVGRELNALHAAVERRSASVLQTTEAIASSLRVIDDVVPAIAWDLVRSTLSPTDDAALD